MPESAVTTEYMVVGLGIAGVAVCEHLRKNNKNFVVFDSGKGGATSQSGGLFNPTVLKRFTAAWKAGDFYPAARRFYLELGKSVGTPVLKEIPIYRIFDTVKEQNDWMAATDKIELKNFLEPAYISNSNPAVKSPLGFGKVRGTGLLNPEKLLAEYRRLLMKENRIIDQQFDYEAVSLTPEFVKYKNFRANKIIFSEGTGAVHNPFFPKDSLVLNKGEYITIRAPELQVDSILKGPVYLIPLGSSLYRAGATFSRLDTSPEPTAAARQELVEKLKKMIDIPFEVVDQNCGFRPTTRDRRPLLGTVTAGSSAAFLNGLGTRGFLMAPLLAEILYEFLENQIQIPAEMNIERVLKD